MAIRGPLTLRNLFYYNLEKAEEIRQTYLSWIGKKAHVGNGISATLENITIRAKKEMNPRNSTDELYKVEFQFENKKCFSAHEFLFNNCLLKSDNTAFSGGKDLTNNQRVA